jgi:hypothetical protein
MGPFVLAQEYLSIMTTKRMKMTNANIAISNISSLRFILFVLQPGQAIIATAPRKESYRDLLVLAAHKQRSVYLSLP